MLVQLFLHHKRVLKCFFCLIINAPSISSCSPSSFQPGDRLWVAGASNPDAVVTFPLAGISF